MEKIVTIPGLTTTKLQLVLAAACLATHTAQGVVTAGLVLALLATRLLLIRQHVDHAPGLVPPTAPTGLGTVRTAVPAPSALTPGGTL
jgi:hypothetical protein